MSAPHDPWTFTWYRRRLEARRGLRVTFDRDELAHAVATPGPQAGPKSGLPLLCLATFVGNHRCNERVEAVRMLGLDIDEPQADPLACVRCVSDALGGVEVFSYSTSSSLPDAFKIRALVPYDRAASADEHRASWALVARVLARAGINVDRACSDPARGFYVWAVPPSGAYFHAHVEGSPWPVAYAAEAETRRRSKLEAERAQRRPIARTSGDLERRARAYLAKCDPAIKGSHGSDTTFAVALKLTRGFGLDVDTAFALMAAEYNPRCVPPWSDRDLRRKVEQAAKAERVGEGWLASGGGR